MKINTKYLPLLTPKGEALANLFESNIKNTTYFNEYLDKNLVPKSILLKYGQISNFVYLKDLKKERKELIKIFFSIDVNNSEIPFSRRDALLLLDLIRFLKK